MGRRGEQRGAADVARLPRLAPRRDLGDRAWRVSRCLAQPGHRRGRRSTSRGRGDHRVGVPDRPRCAAVGPRARRGGRTSRCAAGRRSGLRRVANALREPAGHHRPHRAARGRVRHGGRRDAGGLRVPGLPRCVDAASHGPARAGAARRARHQRLRPTRPGQNARRGTGGADHARPARGHRAPGHARAPAAASAAVRADVPRAGISEISRCS